MEPSDSIARLGFNRWYERRLIEGHAWLVTGFISMITVAACIEELGFRGSITRLMVYVVVVAGATAATIYGVARYQKILLQAERLAQQATCGACGTYARFRMVSPFRVCCRKCSNEWRLIDTD